MRAGDLLGESGDSVIYEVNIAGVGGVDEVAPHGLMCKGPYEQETKEADLADSERNRSIL